MITSRWKLVPWILGLGCLTFTLVGAKNLFQPVSPPVQPGRTRRQSECRLAWAGGDGRRRFGSRSRGICRPGRLAAGESQESPREPGQMVKVGQPLIEFDDSVPHR